MQCPICHSKFTFDFVNIQVDRRKGLIGEWRFYECPFCKVAFQDPLPSYKELEWYYKNYSIESVVDLTQGLGSRFPRLRKIFHWFTGDVDPRDFIFPNKSSKVLDYGCGHAGYLNYFHSKGVEISGAEVSKFIVSDCRKKGLDVHLINDFTKLPFENSSFDTIYLMQVFEHLRDPNSCMAELSRILKNGGSIYLAVPNYQSYWRKLFKNNWVSGWFAPFHLFQYSLATLNYLADHHGFVMSENWSSTPESWFRLNLRAYFSSNHLLDGRKSWSDIKVVRFFFSMCLRIVEFLIQDRDCLVVVLRKK